MAGFKDKSIKKRTRRELNKCAFFILPVDGYACRYSFIMVIIISSLLQYFFSAWSMSRAVNYYDMSLLEINKHYPVIEGLGFEQSNCVEHVKLDTGRFCKLPNNPGTNKIKGSRVTLLARYTVFNAALTFHCLALVIK